MQVRSKVFRVYIYLLFFLVRLYYATWCLQLELLWLATGRIICKNTTHGADNYNSGDATG